MSMRLYDTKQKAVVDFDPPELVRMYTCGITPYDAAHLGHAATYLFYDVLQRRLRDMGHRTQCVRNVTDIDEPLFEKARATGDDWKALGDREVARFAEAMNGIGLLPSFSEPRATESIPDVLGFIGMVLDRGHAYEAGGSVYFDVSTVDDFGSLSGFDRPHMLELAAQNGGNVDDPNKSDPLDFVLWQPSASDEPSWPSMWGPGRPGWHIECSALALRELGTTIELHGGGTDLVFPHHECESVQSYAATGEPFVKHWMHVAMVGMDGEKMSKSLGNLVFVNDLLRDWSGDAVRAAVLSHHYRTPWEWNEELMPTAALRVEQWRRSGEGDAGLDQVRRALDEDLDTPAALDALDRAAATGQGVSKAAAVLGFTLT